MYIINCLYLLNTAHVVTIKIIYSTCILSCNKSFIMCVTSAMYLMQEPLLRALQYLPSIVQLQKVLVACLNHKIDRSEAYTVPTRECFDRIANSGTVCFFGMHV